MNLSSCGIACDVCEFKIAGKCTGCYLVSGKPFWAEQNNCVCDLYECAGNKGLPHCGKCGEFPCDMLEEWAKEGDGEGIRNLQMMGES